MANVEHSVLTTTDLHEPKGAAGASEGHVMKIISGVIAWVAPSTLDGIPVVPLFVMTADKTVANTVTETSLFAGGSGSLTIAANALTVGGIIDFRLTGIISDTATPTLRLRVKFGATTILDSTAVTLGAITNDYFEVKGQIICRTTGVSGTVIGAALFDTSGGDLLPLVRTGGSPDTVTIDTTATQAFDITLEWGAASASNTVTAQVGNLELK